MSYFDSKVIDHFSSYGKLVGLMKSCKCGKVISDTPMPNIVVRCPSCEYLLHPAFHKA